MTGLAKVVLPTFTTREHKVLFLCPRAKEQQTVHARGTQLVVTPALLSTKPVVYVEAEVKRIGSCWISPKHRGIPLSGLVR